MPGIVVKPRARIFHGHEWVYASEIRKLFGDPQPGDVISLKDYRDRPLGSAIYNPASQIVARRFSRRRQAIDLDFLVRRLERAIAYRNRLHLDPPDYARLVWSESDGLPGVIIDRYGDGVVLQTNTLAMDQRRELLVEALQATLSPAYIVERNDSSIRVAEGLENRVGVLSGEPPEKQRARVGAITQSIDVLSGQKTGVYLDQWANYGRVAELARDRNVLDCFSNQGGFALAAKAAGAADVTAVDASETALDAARENAAADGLAIEFEEANAFDYLKAADASERRFGLIVLDPPSFTRSKSGLRDALRGYKELHLRAIRMLDAPENDRPGGVLATFCCSHHVDREAFLGMIIDAAVDARRQLRLVDTYTQRPDHPVLATVPETEYLRGFAFEAIGAW